MKVAGLTLRSNRQTSEYRFPYSSEGLSARNNSTSALRILRISRILRKFAKHLTGTLATQEFVEDKVYWRDPSRENQEN